jgi:transcription elongation factor Elf1
MMKRRSRLWISLTACMLVAGILSGCGEKVTTESLLKDINENYKQAESFKGDLKVDVDLEIEESGVSMNMGMGMDGSIEMTNSPAAMHMDGNLNAELMGIKMAFEMYSIEENEKVDVYTKIADQWTKTEQNIEKSKDTEKSKEIDFEDLFDEGLTLSDKTEKMDDEEVYVLEGKLNGKEMEKQIASLQEEVKEIFKDVDFEKMDIPMTLKVYKDSKLPASVEMDMNSFVSEIFKLMGEEELGSMTAKTCLLTMTFKEYNTVEAIEVPKEALDAVEQNLSDLAGEAL